MDLNYLMFLQSFREMTHDIFTGFFLFMTQFGEQVFPILIVFCIYWCVNKKLGQFIFFGMAYSAFLGSVIKLTACVYRPWVRNCAIIPPETAKAASTGYSFPSGHTAVATVCYGVLAYHYRKYKTLSAYFIIILLCVMFSRNYLGVHTPQDVMVSFIYSVILLVILRKLFHWVESGKNRDYIFAAVSAVIVIISLIYILIKPYPLDYVDGKLLVDPKMMMPGAFNVAGQVSALLIAMILEKRFINFSTEVSMVIRLKRFLSGGLIYAFMYYAGTALANMIFGKLAGAFISTLITTVYCMAIHPYIFMKLEAKGTNLHIPGLH